MLRSNIFLAAGSFFVSVFLVFGTAIVGGVAFGSYYLGEINLTYLYLALLCALPFIVYALIKNRAQMFKRSIIVTSWLLFIAVAFPVQLTLAFENPLLTTPYVFTVLTILPSFGLLMVGVAHFAYK